MRLVLRVLGRAVQVSVAVLLAGLLAGDRGALVVLLLLGTALLVRLLPDQLRPLRPPLVSSVGARPVPSFPSYDRVYRSLLLAEGSGRQYALGVRPVLLRVLAAEVEDRGDQAVRERLGGLWRLVDPAVPHRELDGTTVDDVEQLLRCLERP